MPFYHVIPAAVGSILLLTSAPGAAQTDYEAWARGQQQRLQGFQQQQDQAFLGFLEQEWKRFEVFQGIVRDTTPKPTHLPIATPPSEGQPSGEVTPAPEAPPMQDPAEAPGETVLPPSPTPIDEQISPTLDPDPTPGPGPTGTPPPSGPATGAASEVSAPVPPRPATRPPPQPRPSASIPSQRREMALDYYGTELGVDCGDELGVQLAAPVDAKAIGNFWSDLSKTSYTTCLEQAQAHGKKLRLNDWGYMQLLDRIAAKLYPRSPNGRVLFTWFLMGKAGYDARVGYSDDAVVLMLPANSTVYATPFFTLEGTKYYCLLPEDASAAERGLFTYDGQLEGATAILDLGLSAPPALPADPQQRLISFDFGGQSFKVPLELDRTTARFLEYYPQTDFPVYFSATPSAIASHSLLTELRPLVEGISELEAVNLLLCAVQTGFDYQTDDQQFGREKPLLPDETLYYPSSDCEDRSILFAFLVRELLGLPVVGLDYPGHIATAVGLSGNISGDVVVSGGKRLVICDPTYINATAGMCMPQFKGVKPGIIEMN